VADIWVKYIFGFLEAKSEWMGIAVLGKACQIKDFS